VATFYGDGPAHPEGPTGSFEPPQPLDTFQDGGEQRSRNGHLGHLEDQ
jgi:hypothetical protein